MDGPGLVWTAEAKAETRARVKAVCRSRGASKEVCAWLDASVVRESSARPGVRHVLGEDKDGRQEHGLGPLGLSLRWMRHHWPGTDEDPAFCQPEVSALVALAVAQRAFVAYEADNLVEVQSIFAGQWECREEPDEKRRCTATRTTNPRLCAALRARGVRCQKPLHREDFGRWAPVKARRQLADDLAAAFDARITES